MPRVVDHPTRRRELAAALWHVAGTHGIDAVSVRSVAAAAGHSPGSLRHYFSTQDELVAFALAAMTEQVATRVRHTLATVDDPHERAVALVGHMLPLDDLRRGEVVVWLGFADRALHDPTLAHVRHDGWVGTAHVVRLALADVTGTPRPAALGDPLEREDLEAVVRRLHVMVDGWCLQALSYPEVVTPEVLHAELVREIDAAVALG